MASAFWTFEDGRTFSKRWIGMSYMLEFIIDELKDINEAQEFYKYLEYFVYREPNGDEPNGFGGFIRGNESILLNFDLRTFAPQNREHFWQATQKALTKLKIRKSDQYEGIIWGLTTLLEMHKRIKRGEDPMALNHMNIITPEPKEKIGPGW